MKPVVIVGVGALGSHLALLLRNLENPLTFIDFDRIEAKNLLSQVHTRLGVGKNKAQALEQVLFSLFTGDSRRTRSVPFKLTKDNVEVLLRDAALVVDCTDNAEARQLIQGFVKANSIPCLHGCLAAGGTLGRVIWTERFQADEAGKETATCDDGDFLPFIALVSSYLALAVQRFLKTGERWAFHVLPDKVIRL